MAAALSYYSIFVGGPVLVLTLQLGSLLFGADVTTDTVAQVVRRGLPPGVEGASEVAERMVRMSAPAASLALAAGLLSLLSFTRALATCLNVTLRAGGTEPFYRPFIVGPRCCGCPRPPGEAGPSASWSTCSRPALASGRPGWRASCSKEWRPSYWRRSTLALF